MKYGFRAVTLWALLSVCGCAADKHSAESPSVKTRRPLSESTRCIIQLEIARGRTVDYLIHPTFGPPSSGRHPLCDSGQCAFEVRVGRDKLFVAIDPGRRSLIPRISHNLYEVTVYECSQNFLEVDRDVVTCNFLF